MLLMSYLSKRSLWRKLRSVRSLTRLIRRGAVAPPQPGPTASPPPTQNASAPFEPLAALGHESFVTPPTCNDADAVYNLAALRNGLLSPRDIPDLAKHVSQCKTCQIVLTVIVKELPPVESTANHVPVPATAERPAASAETRRRAPTDEALS